MNTELIGFGPGPPRRLEVDLGIVGAGPAGLFATYYAAVRGLSTAVVDSQPVAGGQVSSLYPDKMIYDVAAHPAITGRQLIDGLLEQISPTPVPLLSSHTVTDLRPAGPNTWELLTDRGSVVTCSTVILGAGAGASGPRRLPCAEPWLDRGTTYAVVSPEGGRDLDVVVVGGGDSAVDCALGLVPTARSVTLVHRSERFRAHEQSVQALQTSPVEVLTTAEVVACYGDPHLTRVTVRGVRDGITLDRPAGLLVVALGQVTRPGPLNSWGMDMDGPKVVVDSRMQSTLPGVFAIGDVATYPGKVPLIVAGFGEAATAVNNAAVLIRPQEGLDPGHSTDRPPAAADPDVRHAA